MRKEELKQLAIDKLVPEAFAAKKYSYYLWMCMIQQWLRDVYDFHVIIEPMSSGRYGSNILANHLIDESYKEEDFFNTYEEALEDALIALLKEIKILN